MQGPYRFALFFVALVCAISANSQIGALNLPPVVQRFGPLVVVAFDEEAADPVMLRTDMFSDRKEDRLRTIRAMGMESDPELRALWSRFFSDHAGQGDDKGIMQFISGGMLDWNFGEAGSKQYVLGMGFDELTERPLKITAVFESRANKWRHVATLACQCQMNDTGEPFNPHPGKYPIPSQEWVVTLPRGTDDHDESHTTEIRFRLRGGRLWPLIQFENWHHQCPVGMPYGSSCNVVESRLEKATLVDTQGRFLKGFVLISWSGSPPPCEKCGMLLHYPRCCAYVWDESAFQYLPTEFKPIHCGPTSDLAHRESTSNQLQH